MNDTKYNGWTNYATWRINLEMFDGLELSDITYQPSNTKIDIYDLSKSCEEYVQNYLSETTEGGLAFDYALAFISDVNWYEIAESMQAEYNDNNEESEAA